MKWSEFLQFTPDERKAVIALVLFTAGGGIVLEVARRHPEWTPGIRTLSPQRADSMAARVDSVLPGPGAPVEATAARQESGLLGGALPPVEGVESASTAGRPSPEAPQTPPAPVDLNRADPAALESLPGIGPAMARRIVEEREARGPFRRPEDLLRVKGIGPATLKRLRPFLAPFP